MRKVNPPKQVLHFLRWFCREEYIEEIEGDLTEIFRKQSEASPRKAKWKFAWSVIRYFRPQFMKSFKNSYQANSPGMYKSYFKIGWRNLIRNKGFSFINIGGLALGMAVAILIGLWVYDELTFDSYHSDHDRIAQVMRHEVSNGQISTTGSNPAVMAEEIHNVYDSDFKYVLQSLWIGDHILTYGDKMFLQNGNYAEPHVTDMLSLEMTHGSKDGLKNMNSILLSASVAKSYFGEDDPVGKILRVDDRTDVQVTGVYEDIPDNSSFKDLKFILPLELWLSNNRWIKEMNDPWGSSIIQTYVQIADHADMQQVSAKIKDVMLNKVSESGKRYKPEVFLHPMNKWHLYSDFKNGINTGGRIDNVWLFGIAGVFVLLLACINFMNLSTARSEKRSREVGIRKSIGSVRSQLIAQFFSESVMISVFAFLFSLLIAATILPMFNEVADKKLAILWSEPMFWLAGIGFSVVTGLFAGLYPALFLSSFQPVKVLKGTFKAGRFASLPRKVLVVVQFTISITLIISTMVVYKQIKHAQGRPIGYSRDGLIHVGLNWERKNHFEAIRTELKNEGTIIEMAQSGSPVTDAWFSNAAFNWDGKDPDQTVSFPNNAVNHEYGKTIGWEIKEGRDFSRDFVSDSSAFILNESAVKFIGLKDPIGKIIRWKKKPFTVIGVVKNMLVQSPYSPVRPSLFHLSTNNINISLIRINPEVSLQDAMGKIETVFKKYNPASPFQASFVDEEFARKFGNEKTIGTLAAFFAVLAVIISCLGLFGLASFVAEQRTKEIGIRKVFGASVANLWQMLSKEFALLVILSCLVAIPIAYYYLNNWLMAYEYHTDIPWWIFGISCFGALIITLLTVSFQAVKAAVMNPIKSLKAD